MNNELNSIGLNKKPSDTTVVSLGFFSSPIEFILDFIKMEFILISNIS